MRSKSLVRSALGALVAGVLSTGQAHAVVVNVDGQDWDVTTFSGSYTQDTAKFNVTNIGGEMPWWNNETLAFDFASAVANALGHPNSGYGPWFAWMRNGELVGVQVYVGIDPLQVRPTVVPTTEMYPEQTYYAKATTFTPPAPGPLPIFGSAAAFGFSRKLRKRIKSSGNPVSSRYTI